VKAHGKFEPQIVDLKEVVLPLLDKLLKWTNALKPLRG
jgi:hypothetical protein